MRNLSFGDRIAMLALVALALLFVDQRRAGAVTLPGTGAIELVSSTCTALAADTTGNVNVALAAGTKYRVQSDANVFLRVGAAATTANIPLGSYVPEEMAFARTGGTAPVVYGKSSSGTANVSFCPITDAK